MNGEELLSKCMSEGWNIHIECKGLGRNYEMTYEATAYKVNWTPQEQIFNKVHGVGDSIKELLKNMFGEDIDN